MLRLVLALLGVWLVACSSGQRSPSAPELRILALQLDGAHWEASFAVENRGSLTLEIQQLEFAIELGDAPLGQFRPSLDLSLPAGAREGFELSGELPSPLPSHALPQLRYEIEGTAMLKRGRLKIDSTGWLYPTPGRPGAYR